MQNNLTYSSKHQLRFFCSVCCCFGIPAPRVKLIFVVVFYFLKPDQIFLENTCMSRRHIIYKIGSWTCRFNVPFLMSLSLFNFFTLLKRRELSFIPVLSSATVSSAILHIFFPVNALPHKSFLTHSIFSLP